MKKNLVSTFKNYSENVKFSETNLDLTPSPTSPRLPSEETKDWEFYHPKTPAVNQDQHPGKAVKVKDIIL